VTTIEPRFALTGHACRFCLGRILERDGVFMCSVCETSATGNVAAICGCGMRSSTQLDLPKGLRAAYQCSVNADRTIVNPARIVILYGGKPARPLEVV
jgi:hypothetical protein